MKALDPLCKPRASVFDKSKRDTVLDLTNLARGQIDAGEFFEENYVTDGMKTLLRLAFMRLEGRSAQGLFKLTQAMGGGKTHNLLVLGLLAKHPTYRTRLMEGIHKVDAGLGEVRVVAFSGRESDAKFGIWGEIADQLGKSQQTRLLLGTDAASEGLNLQRLARLINLDLPWNPTRLEQRKGRIQRIGQTADTVYIYNLRYRDSVEDQVHRMLSNRLRDIYTLFGQIPDVLEDAWILLAQGEREAAERLIDALRRQHPFEIRYSSAMQKTDWESCRQVLQRDEKRRVLSQGW